MPPQGNRIDLQEDLLESELPPSNIKTILTSTTSSIMSSVIDHIGNTPLIRLNKIPQSMGIKCEVLAKCEFYGPGGSHKDRIALKMVEDAERAGTLKPGFTIIEPTSGNTGIGLALVAAVKGYKCIFVMPEKNSQEKLDTMAALGAKIIKTPGVPIDSPESYFSVAKRIHEQTPNSLILNQYENDGNPKAHYEHSAVEILNQCDGKLDMLVAGVGTGGAITGLGKRMQESCKMCTVVGVDPEGSLMAQPASINTIRTKWEIEGIGHDDFIPVVLDRSVVHKWVKTNDKESFEMARRLIQEEGLLVGGSCGSVLAGALKAIKEADLKEGQRCVIFFPDSIRNYMSKFLSDQWLLEKNLLAESSLKNFNGYSWWTKTISDMNISTPLTITPESTIHDTLNILKTHSLTQIPVVDNNGLIRGIVTLNTLLSKVLENKVCRNDKVISVLSRQFKKISKETILAKAVHILQGGNSALIVQTQLKSDTPTEILVGVLTQMDLLTFITNSESD